ncbi:MAG: EF-P lysine aminoacylase GenX [Rhodospirillales bacterium]|nr:EF-P lysine aminoacylase GenX [Rhodospirillales bacterium]
MDKADLLWWAPEHYARRRPRLLKRQRALAALRSFFAARDFVEVETPTLQISPGLEPHLQAFETSLAAPDGRRRRRYLHTSPEFTCKKLLAAGERRLFTLARVFRNGEAAATHHPEFTLLEWYRAEPDLTRIMEDCIGLLRCLAEALEIPALTWQGRNIDPFQPFERLSVQEAFEHYAGIDLLATVPDPLAPNTAYLRQAARRIGIRVADDDSWADLVTKIQLDCIELNLGTERATFLTDYPLPLAALARPNPADPRLAERFELYVGGLELANAFGELNDPVEQRRRFEADMELKERLYGERYPIDEDFLKALPFMPPACGIALGIDRLAMLMTGADTIEEVLWAPVR